MWDERFERLESSVDALHAPPLVAVGDLTADSPLLVPGCFWGQGNVGQTAVGEKLEKLFYLHLRWKIISFKLLEKKRNKGLALALLLYTPLGSTEQL